MKFVRWFLLFIILFIFTACYSLKIPDQKISCTDGREGIRNYKLFPKQFPDKLFEEQACTYFQLGGMVDTDNDAVPDVGVCVHFVDPYGMYPKYASYVHFKLNEAGDETEELEMYAFLEYKWEEEQWIMRWINVKAPNSFKEWMEREMAMTNAEEDF